MSNRNAYIEITMLILVSVSPLLSQPIKAVLILIFLLRNYKYLFKSTKKNASLIGMFMIIFLWGLILDFRNISSLSQINILNLYFPMCIISGYVISEKYTLDKFFYILDRIIFVLATLSLISVVIYTFLPSIVTYLPSYNYYHTTHKTAILFNILTNGPEGVLTRNAGIAWEPGAFQFVVNLGLYAYLKTTKKINLFKIALYSIVIITTKSTAGILIFIVITFKLFLENKKARLLIISSILLFSGLILDELLYQYKYKLFGSYAFQIRMEPLLNAYNTGKSHVFGLGNSGFDIFYRNMITPPWDSFGQMFIRYGYFLLLFITIRLFTLVNKNKILLVILLVTFSSQNVWFFPLVTPFYFNFRKIDIQKNNTIGEI